MTSDTKATAARLNGRKGGRPRNPMTVLAAESGLLDSTDRVVSLLDRSHDLYDRVVCRWIGRRKAFAIWNQANDAGTVALVRALHQDPQFKSDLASGDESALSKAASIHQPVRDARLTELLEEHRSLMLRRNPRKMAQAEAMLLDPAK